MTRLRAWLSSPWANGLGLLIGIVSLPLGVIGIILTVNTLQRKEVAYLVPDTSVKVFDSRLSSSAYRILDQNNTPITNDIYSTEVTLWNSGNQPIEPAEVRAPVRIVLFPAQRILEYKIVNQTRPDVARFTVREVDLTADTAALARYEPHTRQTKDGTAISGIDRNAHTKALEVTWDHFDPNFGVKVQVTYVGQGTYDNDFRIHLDYYIIGVGPFIDGQQPTIGRFIGYNPAVHASFFVGSVMLAIVFFFGGMFLGVILEVDHSRKGLGRLVIIVSGLLLVGFIFFAAYAITATITPPL